MVAAPARPAACVIATTRRRCRLLAWKLPLQQAIDLPNLVARGDEYNGEASKFSPQILAGLGERGITVKSGRGEESGLQGLVVNSDGTTSGAADPRREGVWRTK